MLGRLAPYLLLLTAALSAALIVADIKGYFREVKQPIAKLVKTSGTVKRLPKDEFGWDLAVKGTQFAEGDSISVGEGSVSVLEFTNGSTVELSEGTLMVLTSREEKVELKFASGRAKLVVNGSEQENLFKISQKSNQQQIEIVDQQKSAQQKSAPEVKSEPVVPPPAPKKTEVARVAPAPVIVPLAPLLNSPVQNATVYTNKNSDIEFTWNPAKPDSSVNRYELTLIAADGQRKILESSSNRLKLMMLKEGKYSWSVKAINAQGMKSDASAVHAMQVLSDEKVARPQLVKPKAVAAIPAPKPRAPAEAKPVLQAPKLAAPSLAAPKLSAPVLGAPKLAAPKLSAPK